MQCRSGRGGKVKERERERERERASERASERNEPMEWDEGRG